MQVPVIADVGANRGVVFEGELRMRGLGSIARFESEGKGSV